jgi:hypothetical protein
MRNLFFFLLFSVFILSCSEEDKNDYITISGRVIDSSKSGISDVTVSLPQLSIEIQTTVDGSYTMKFAKANMSESTIIHLIYEKEGYFPLNKHFCVCNGEMNVQMRSFADAAYFSVNLNEKQVSSAQGFFAVGVNSNVNYVIENTNEWLHYNIYNDSVYFYYDENEIPTDRNAIVKFEAEYNLSHEITITQSSGPALKVMDYIGKDNVTSFLTATPFITFNREVKILSIKSSHENINLGYLFSADKKTILFPNLKIPALEKVVIYYTAMATDSAIVTDSFELKVYESIIDSDQNGQKIIFTKDNDYFWLHTPVHYGKSSLIKYSAKDLSVASEILWKDDLYSDFFYNPYNNTILIVQNYNTNHQGIIAVFDAINGQFVEEIDLTKALNGKNSITQMAFGSNGFGLIMGYPSNVFYLDSSNNYECGLFSENSMFYDSHGAFLVRNMESCNKGQTLALFDYNAIYNIFTIDTDTKNIQHHSVDAEYYLTNYSYPGVFVGSEYNKTGTYIDVNTGSKSTMRINNAGYHAVFLKTNDALPTLLTAGLSMINFQTKNEKKFECLSDVYLFASSNDSKMLVIGYKKNLLLIKSEIFTKYFDKLK